MLHQTVDLLILRRDGPHGDGTILSFVCWLCLLSRKFWISVRLTLTKKCCVSPPKMTKRMTHIFEYIAYIFGPYVWVANHILNFLYPIRICNEFHTDLAWAKFINVKKIRKTQEKFQYLLYFLYLSDSTLRTSICAQFLWRKSHNKFVLSFEILCFCCFSNFPKLINPVPRAVGKAAFQGGVMV